MPNDMRKKIRELLTQSMSTTKFPYKCSYSATIAEANSNKNGWLEWDGVALTAPEWVKDTDGVIYSGEEWYAKHPDEINNCE